jgi:hypothetical protein
MPRDWEGIRNAPGQQAEPIQRSRGRLGWGETEKEEKVTL